MRPGLHLFIVLSLVLPFETDRWLMADLMPVNATVVDIRIIAPPRPRIIPIVSLELTYTVRGSEHSARIVALEPADGRYNWRPEERAAAERFVLEHGIGTTVELWVPRLFPGYGALLANGANSPGPQPRSAAYLIYLGVLAAYLGVVLTIWSARRRLANNAPKEP